VAATDVTIASELNRSKVEFDGKFPATDLITALLEYIGLSTKLFGRDVLTAGQAFHRSLKVYGGIRECIGKVSERSTKGGELLTEGESLTSFYAYTKAIPLLGSQYLTFFYPNSKH
jgi:hypothetical protein